MLYPDRASSGPYLDSAHGNYTGSSPYGVLRTSLSTPPNDYGRGNCAHCHEQHASIGGAEPAPTGGPDKYALFYTNHVSQTDNFCFKCHDNTTTYAATAIKNYTYSYRAGACPAATCSEDDILQVFTYGPPTSTTTSSHRLDDIKTFINGKWNYTADSNPCGGCHNPHRAQGDPANSTLTKSSITRGWPVSRPSQHSKDNNAWGLWGDNLLTATERMSNYVGALTYQAPYRYYTTTPSSLEPQGNALTDNTTAAASTTDFVTFCTDCHHYSPTPVSTRLGNTNLRDINWETSVHGKVDSYFSSDISERDAPYNVTKNYVLSCTDCHEPHGSPNYCYLIRKEVNGATTSFTGDTRAAWDSLCNWCHTSHVSSHKGSQDCSNCHYHGATQWQSGESHPIF